MELDRHPHAARIDAILRDLDVNIDRGLDPRDVEQRRARFGPNRLPPPPRRSLLLLAAAVSIVWICAGANLVLFVIGLARGTGA